MKIIKIIQNQSNISGEKQYFYSTPFIKLSGCIIIIIIF